MKIDPEGQPLERVAGRSLIGRGELSSILASYLATLVTPALTWGDARRRGSADSATLR
jgi:hypothetical protein